MRKRKILRFLGIALLAVFDVLAFLPITDTVTHAAGLIDTAVNDANAYSKYPLENYQLDSHIGSSWDWLPWNWLDGIGKSIQYGLHAITNFVWTVSLYISSATGYVVQEAHKLDFISGTANSIGKSIQALAGVTKSGFSSEGFYVGFLLILTLVTGIYIAYTGLIKREATKAVHAVVSFLVVFILSASFIAYAPNCISKINDFSSDISSSALSLGTKIVLPDSSGKGKDSMDLIRDNLFSIQVKRPQLLLQYGESDIKELGSDRVESLLSESSDTDDREDIVIGEIEDKDNGDLSVTKTMTRLGMAVFLFIFNIGIPVFVFLLTGMMIFSQVLFTIYAMFLSVSFTLSMIPTYEGMAKNAITKLFNIIMMRVGISLIIITAFSISTMFYSISSGYPFFVVAFLQIVIFTGIYFKLGDLMAMFSLQSSDTQRVSRRIMRRPYLLLNRGARRLKRKVGRTVAAGAVGGLVGAAAVSQSRKTNNAKPAGSGRSRPNHDTSADTSSFGKRAGAEVGAVLDNRGRMKDKAKSVGQWVKDMPTLVQYALHSGVNQIQESISDFKCGIVEEKATRKQGRANKQTKHRQTIAQRRTAMDKMRLSNESAAKGAAPLHERPVATLVPAKVAPWAAVSKGAQTIRERPVTTTKGQPPVKSREPATRVQEVRMQTVRESTAPVRQQTSQAAADTTRQTVQRREHVQSVQKKQKNKTTASKTTVGKSGKG